MTYNALRRFAWPDGTYSFERPWTLSDVTYLLTVRWNWRAGTYQMDFADAAGVPYVMGIPLRTGVSLLAPYTNRGLPPGALLVYDSTGQQRDAGLNDFARTHLLVYAYRDDTAP